MTARRALVTGAGGFVGRWLCRELAGAGWEVIGTTLESAAGDQAEPVQWRYEDLRDAGAVADVVTSSRPDAIFHLAGIAFVPAAKRDPELAMRVNVGNAVRLLATVDELRVAGTCDPIVLLVGSAEQYGRHEAATMPLTERAVCAPRNLYAATKQAQEIFGLQAFCGTGTRVICTRSFNHSGPGQSPDFLLPALVRRVRAVQARHEHTIAIGNRDTVRDFLHVRDVARAYIALVERGTAGEVYNVCSGVGSLVGDVVAEVCRIAGVDAEVTTDSSLQRAVDVPILVGSNDKLRAHTGWAPVLSRADIITDLLNAASH